jgi:hypothetical protein
MFSTKNVTITPVGMSGACAANVGSTRPERAISPRKAPNHGTACRAPTNSSAPNGHVTAHRLTADELPNPPRLHCKTIGNTRVMHSWLRRNSR